MKRKKKFFDFGFMDLSDLFLYITAFTYVFLASVFGFGGSLLQKRRFLGRCLYYFRKIYTLPVLRIFFPMALMMLNIYVLSKFYILFSLLSRVSATIFNVSMTLFHTFEILRIVMSIILIFKRQEKTKETKGENYCSEDGCYYKNYMFYSDLFRIPIVSENIKYYCVFTLCFMITSTICLYCSTNVFIYRISTSYKRNVIRVYDILPLLFRHAKAHDIYFILILCYCPIVLWSSSKFFECTLLILMLRYGAKNVSNQKKKKKSKKV